MNNYLIMKHVICENPIWPLGQAVKTPPSHGGFMGSSPVGVTSYSTLLPR